MINVLKQKSLIFIIAILLVIGICLFSRERALKANETTDIDYGGKITEQEIVPFEPVNEIQEIILEQTGCFVAAA